MKKEEMAIKVMEDFKELKPKAKGYVLGYMTAQLEKCEEKKKASDKEAG